MEREYIGVCIIEDERVVVKILTHSREEADKIFKNYLIDYLRLPSRIIETLYNNYCFTIPVFFHDIIKQHEGKIKVIKPNIRP